MGGVGLVLMGGALVTIASNCMACPLFQPVASLGDYYAGDCASATNETIPPDTLRHCCNTGYARRVCPRVCRYRKPMRFEFVLRADRGGEIELGWAMERNHHPLAVGVMLLPETASTPLEYQAKAFGASYLSQKS